MEPPYRFQHIRIEHCWPDSEDLLRDCEQKVTPRGRNHVSLKGAFEDASGQRQLPTSRSPFLQLVAPFVPDLRDWGWIEGTLLNTLGLLQVCLLCTDPFRGCDAEHVWALHYNNPRESFPCRNRSTLVENLALALLNYESGFVMYERKAQISVENSQRALETLRLAKAQYLLQRRRRQLLHTASRKRLREDTLTKCLETLQTMIEHTALEASVERSETSERNLLTRCMVHTFEQHGPQPRDWPRQATYHAVQAILNQLSVETKGSDDSHQYGPDSVRMRHSRARKPPTS